MKNVNLKLFVLAHWRLMEPYMNHIMQAWVSISIPLCAVVCCHVRTHVE